MLEGIVLAIFEELRLRRRYLHHSARSKSVPDSHNPRRIRIRERTKKEGVHNAVDSGRRANAERQSNHCNCSECGTLAQLAQCVADVLNQSVHYSYLSATMGSTLAARRAG